MKFKYEAKKDVNNVVRGELDASSKDLAVDMLIEQNLYPILVEPVSSTVSEKKESIMFLKKKVSQKDILTFSRNLLVFVRAKIELMQALQMLRDQSPKESALWDLLNNFYLKTRDGQTLSVILMGYPELFSYLYVSIISTGEVSGKLDEALEQIADYMQRKEDIKRKINSALAYPAILLSVGLLSIYVLMNFVVPRLKPVLDNLGDDLPIITKLILRISDISNQNILLFLFLFFGAILYLYTNRKSKKMKDFCSAFVRKLPIVRRLINKQELANFTRALCMLLKSKVSILQSFDVARKIVSDAKLRKELSVVCENVGSGESLSESLGSDTQLPDFFVKMVAVGEKSGRLSEVLDEVVNSYEQDISGDVEMVSSLLEPILILVLGSVLGIIVLSILIPMFQITQTLG